MLFKGVARFIPTISWKRDIVYEVDDETGYVYMGPERRNTVRLYTTVIQKLTTMVSAVQVQMMPKTLKIEPIEKEVA